MVLGNGALAGLVAITGSCAVVYPWAAIIIGGVAGPLYVLASWVNIKLRVSPVTPFTHDMHNASTMPAHAYAHNAT